ncbi:MAG: ADP-ribosylglycohydrolase family protein [Cyanobacteria bacterium J06621_3]
MLGVIAGDIIGSVHERSKTKVKDFPLFVADSHFTDDTVLSVAVADALLNNRLQDGSYVQTLKEYGKDYMHVGYGKSFKRWLASDSLEPYNSWGNGSAMRVSPVGFAYESISDVMVSAQKTAEVTHNHTEGVKGAQATAACVFLAKRGDSKVDIKSHIEQTFGYDLGRSLADIRPGYKFYVSCQRSVPESIIAFLESTDFEDAVRNAVSLGGDADTMAAIAGGIAEAFYGGVPDAIAQEALSRLDAPLRTTTLKFCDRYTPPPTTIPLALKQSARTTVTP